MDIKLDFFKRFISHRHGIAVVRDEDFLNGADASIVAREAMPSTTLSLPVVLCIAIGGGLLIFLALGFLLIFVLRRRDAVPATRHIVYATGRPPQPVPPGSQSLSSLTTAAIQSLRRPSATRLVKRTQNNCSRETLDRMSSREDMGDGVDAMGMMPAKYSFRGRSGSQASKGAMSRKGSVGAEGGRGWVEGHEPKTKRRSWRQSWEAWLRGAPTLPDVSAIEAATGEQDRNASDLGDTGSSLRTLPLRGNQYIEQRRTHQLQQQTFPTRGRPVTHYQQFTQTAQVLARRNALQRSQTAPSLSGGMPQFVGVKAPARAHFRPMSVRDADLHDILSMTEKRLREGSQSNTPRTSPSKSSPVKTPGSVRPNSGRLRNPTTPRSAGSPSKTIKLVQPSGTYDRTRAQTPGSITRDMSNGSIGSVARALLNEAAEELKMDATSSAARSSPVRTVQHQSPSKGVQPPTTIRLQRRRSIDSDVSSSLSTLYSVNDEEEHQAILPKPLQSSQPQGLGPEDDPFVEQRLSKDFTVEKRLSSWENQSLAVDAGAFRKRRNDPKAVTSSGSSSEESQICPSACVSPLRPMSAIHNSQQRRGSVVSWLQPPVSDAPVTEVRKVSDESMTSVSVNSSSDDDAAPPSLDSSSSRTASPTSPHRRSRHNDEDEAQTDTEGEGFDEGDILSLLLSSAGPKRALPAPPDHQTPTKLSPPPKAHTLSRSTSIAQSDDSSVYDPPHILDSEDLDIGTGMPMVMTPDGHQRNVSVDLTTTISELRRMNSLVSSYSVASMTSLSSTEDAAATSLRGGGFSPERSGSVVMRAGRRNYLSIGGTPPAKLSMESRQSLHTTRSQQGPQGVRHKRNKSSIGDRDAAVKVKAGTALGMGNRQTRSEMSLRTQRRPPRLAGVNLVEELISEEKMKRASQDSLGLYDRHGFLIGSPTKETHLEA